MLFIVSMLPIVCCLLRWCCIGVIDCMLSVALLYQFYIVEKDRHCILQCLPLSLPDWYVKM